MRHVLLVVSPECYSVRIVRVDCNGRQVAASILKKWSFLRIPKVGSLISLLTDIKSGGHKATLDDAHTIPYLLYITFLDYLPYQVVLSPGQVGNTKGYPCRYL